MPHCIHQTYTATSVCQKKDQGSKTQVTHELDELSIMIWVFILIYTNTSNDRSKVRILNTSLGDREGIFKGNHSCTSLWIWTFRERSPDKLKGVRLVILKPIPDIHNMESLYLPSHTHYTPSTLVSPVGEGCNLVSHYSHLYDW